MQNRFKKYINVVTEISTISSTEVHFIAATMQFSSAHEFITNIEVNTILEKLVEKTGPLLYSIADRVNVDLDEYLLNYILRNLKVLVRAISFYTVKAIFSSKTFFKSKYSFIMGFYRPHIL